MADGSALPVLVAALVVLSGCSALPSGGPAAGPTETVAATPTPTLDDVALPPGVRADRVDAAPLVAAHAGALGNASRTVVRETRARTPANVSSRTVARFAGDGRMVVTNTGRTRGGAGAVATYVGEDRIYLKRTAGGETTYRTVARTRRAVVATRDRAGSVATLRSVLRVANLTPVGVRTVNGTPMVVLRGGADGPGGQVGTPSGSDFEATLLVTERGVVRRLSMTARSANRTGEAAMTMRVRDVGATTVERPAWVADAVAATNGTPAAANLTLASATRTATAGRAGGR